MVRYQQSDRIGIKELKETGVKCYANDKTYYVIREELDEGLEEYAVYRGEDSNGEKIGKISINHRGAYISVPIDGEPDERGYRPYERRRGIYYCYVPIEDETDETDLVMREIEYVYLAFADIIMSRLIALEELSLLKP